MVEWQEAWPRFEKSYLFSDLLILRLLDDSKGKKFWKNGCKYEGEWKDSKKDGTGKKEVMYLWLIITLHDDSIGKWFGAMGEIYEGGWKDNKMHGFGKIEMIYFMIYWF